MHKKISGVIGMLALLILVGCSGKSDIGKKVCTMKDDGMNYNIELEYDGDKIIKINHIQSLNFVELGSTEETVKEVTDEAKEELEKVKGVKYTAEIKGEEVIETIVLDLEKAKLSELDSSGILLIDGDNVDYISLEKTLANYEKMGMKCK